MRKKSRGLIFFVSFFVLVLAVMLSPASAKDWGTGKKLPPVGKDWPKHLSGGVGSPTTSHYFVLTGLGQMMKKYLSGTTLIAEGTGGAIPNMHLLHKGDLQISTNAGDSSRNAALGQKPFEKTPLPNLRLICPYQPFAQKWFVKADSGIKKFEDLKGKRVMCKAPTAPLIQTDTDITLECHGMTPDDFSQYLPVRNQRQAANGLKDRAADCVAWGDNLVFAGAAFTEMAQTLGVRQISLGMDKLKCINQKCMFLIPMVQKPNMFKGVDYPVNMAGWELRITGLASMPDTLVYAMMMLMFDDKYRKEFLAIHPSCVQFTLERALTKNPEIPFHNGVVMYWKDRGMWNDALEKVQQERLKELGAGT